VINKIKDILGILIVIIQVVVALVEMGNNGGNGQAKRTEAIGYLKQILSGIDIPFKEVLVSDAVLGLLIDVVVMIFNKTGFFTKSAS